MKRRGAKTSNESRPDPTKVEAPARGTQTGAVEPRGRGVVSNPVTSPEVKPAPRKPKKTTPKEPKKVTLSVLQSDSFGYRLASLPMARKDKELVAALVADELGIKDLDRFMREVHREDVPTPKT